MWEDQDQDLSEDGNNCPNCLNGEIDFNEYTMRYECNCCEWRSEEYEEEE
jgi:hypothetical protein